MVNIYYTQFTSEPDAEIPEKYSRLLPPYLYKKYNSLRYQKDRYGSLSGKLLLLYGLHQLGETGNRLWQLAYNAYGRPFLPGRIDFNISHSHHIAVCAISENHRVGVDIERIAPANLDDLSEIMTPEQWNAIRQADEPLKEFYRLWAVRESIAKADGRGLSMPAESIVIHKRQGAYYTHDWKLTALGINEDYAAYLATDTQPDCICLKEITMETAFNALPFTKNADT